MKGTFHDADKHIVQWPNTALNESKARKFRGRAKQPDFVVSIAHQSQTVANIFIGEVSPPSQKTNVYKNCCDLIRLGIFMKDCMDFAIEKGADINVIGFQCVGKQNNIKCFFTHEISLNPFWHFIIDHIIDFYTIDLVEGIYIMVHIGQVSVPASLKEMLSFVDQIETLLGIREIFKRSFDILYNNLCNPNLNLSSVKKTFKRDTLNTPQFNNLVSRTRDCHRICPFYYGRF